MPPLFGEVDETFTGHRVEQGPSDVSIGPGFGLARGRAGRGAGVVESCTGSEWDTVEGEGEIDRPPGQVGWGVAGS